MDIDQLCQDEIDDLQSRINSADLLSVDLKNLFKDTQIVRSHLDTAQEFANRKEYTNAYKSLLNSMSKLIYINQQIIDKYSSFVGLMKDSDGSQTKN